MPTAIGAGRISPEVLRHVLLDAVAVRAQEVTQEVFPSRSVVVTRKPHPGVPTVEQLKAERVGTVPGTSMYEALLDLGLPPGKIESTLTSGDLSEALRSGKITAAVWWLDAAIQAQRQDPSLQIGLSLGLPEGLAYGVRREDRALLEALNQHLQVVRTSGNWNRLAVKYFGDATATILGRAKQE